MEKKERRSKSCFSRHKMFILYFLVAVAMTVVLFFLTSCRTRIKTIYVDKIKTEYRDVVRIDSVYNRDTVNVYTAGDTVYRDVIKWRERWRLRVDSFTRVDSVPYSVEVVKEVNRLTTWQHRQIVGFWALLGVVGVAVAIKLRP